MAACNLQHVPHPSRGCQSQVNVESTVTGEAACHDLVQSLCQEDCESSVPAQQETEQVRWPLATCFASLAWLSSFNRTWLGCFNSAPHQSILQSLQFVLYQLAFHVTTRQNDKKFRIFRGTRRFAARQTKTLWVHDLVSLVRFLLQSSISLVDSVRSDRFRAPRWDQPSLRSCAAW